MPFANEHSARLLDPNTGHVRVRRSKNGTVQGTKLPATISTIWYIRKSDDGEYPQAQALRFPVKNWSEPEARKYLKDNKIKFISFEAATPEGNLCYTAVNKSDDEIDIRLHGDIGFKDENTSQAFYDLLTPNLKVINIDMNTRGGSVMDGLSIYNQLKDHPAQVNIKISGAAASMGSVVAMSADTITMPKTAVMMLHKPLVPIMIAANADKLRKSAEALDVMETSIVAAYETRLNKTESEIAEMLEEETWLNGETASELGLVDKVTSEPVNKDLIYHDFSAYKNVPDMAVAMSIDADDEIDIPEAPEELGILAKIRNLLDKELLPLKKEKETTMSDEKIQAELTTAKAKNVELEASVTSATGKNTTLEAENKELKTKLSGIEKETEVKDKEARIEEYKTICEGFVGEGKMRPVDTPYHIMSMEMNFQQDKAGETKKLDEYKDWLKSLPVILDVSGEHVAAKNVISEPSSDDKLEVETRKIMQEQKIGYADALREAYRAHPEYLNK